MCIKTCGALFNEPNKTLVPFPVPYYANLKLKDIYFIS